MDNVDQNRKDGRQFETILNISEFFYEFGIDIRQIYETDSGEKGPATLDLSLIIITGSEKLICKT